MGLNPIPIAVGPAETVAKYVALYDNIQHSVRCDHDIFLVGVLILGLDCLTDTVYLGEMLQDFGCLYLLVYLLAAQYQFVMTLTEQLDPVDDLIVCSQYRRSVPPLLRRFHEVVHTVRITLTFIGQPKQFGFPHLFKLWNLLAYLKIAVRIGDHVMSIDPFQQSSVL